MFPGVLHFPPLVHGRRSCPEEWVIKPPPKGLGLLPDSQALSRGGKQCASSLVDLNWNMTFDSSSQGRRTNSKSRFLQSSCVGCLTSSWLTFLQPLLPHVAVPQLLPRWPHALLTFCPAAALAPRGAGCCRTPQPSSMHVRKVQGS